jgi:drug/metabolite transporter (DMT)-like permease
MTLPVDVTLLVLLAALMHASWNAIAKSADITLLDIATMAVAAAALCAVALPFLPFPEPASWPWLAASVLLHFLYFAALVGAYQHGDLSHAYPLMRGLAPMLVALTGAAFLAERLTATMWLGVALICGGVLLPFGVRGATSGLPRRGTLFALGNAVIIASYTLVDGMGTRLSTTPLAYCLWLFVFDALPITALAFARHGGAVVHYMRGRWRAGLLGGALTVGSYGIVLWAMTRAPIAAVAALRETSVIFAAVIGSVLLREGFGAPRIAGALLVAAGIGALRFSA